MTVADYCTLGIVSVLVIIASWLTARSLRLGAPARSRSILEVCGLFLVAASIITFATMRLEFARTPSVVGNLGLALTVLRRYTRFRPEYLALGGIARSLAGAGKARWLVVLAGALMAAWWYLFEVSFL